MDEGFRYEDKEWQKTDAKEFFLKEISVNSSVLDLGCWTGRFGDKLKKEKKCFVVGVDVNKKAIKIASERLDKVCPVDLENPPNLLGAIKNQAFDYIILADVLEHLKNPKDLLLAIKKSMGQNTKLMISVPNIAYHEIRLNLLRGKFDYGKTGILDETHLRFFTKKTITRLVENCGFKIEKFMWSGRKWWPELNAIQLAFVLSKK